MRAALIGVTSSEFRRVGEHHETPQGEPPRREMALGVVYGEAVAAAGGIPVILTPTPTRALDTILDRLDGLCLSGGPDVHPTAYGAEPRAELGPTEPEADAFEIALVRRAAKRGMPVLGICRGMQVLNVAAGGTLRQHIDGHRQKQAGDTTTHAVEIEAGTRLHGLVGEERVEVNSFHHQAPDRLGRGLHAVARSEDGVIEGIEDPSAPFRVGVQWHAECLVARAEQLAIFEGLVAAAAESWRAVA